MLQLLRNHKVVALVFCCRRRAMIRGDCFRKYDSICSPLGVQAFHYRVVVVVKLLVVVIVGGDTRSSHDAQLRVDNNHCSCWD